MSSPMHNAGVVITGLGLVTSLGTSPAETFDAMLAGRVGLGPMPALEQRPQIDKGGGQAVELPAEQDPSLPREARYLRHAVSTALADARSPARGGRLAVVMGTTLHGMRAAGRALRSGDWSELRDFPAKAVLESACAGLGVGGESHTLCSACSSGLAAVSLGALLLREGLADAVIAGGYDAVSEYAYAGFDSLRLVSAGDTRPFSLGREGMKVAEGYAALVLEREGDAHSRGARVRGHIAGIAETADCFHLTKPHPEGEGAARAVRGALSAAGVGPASIGLIAAHATGTPANDAAEYAALRAVFGAALPGSPVTAFKSRIGHTLGGAGAVELVLSVLARERGVIPASAGTREPEPRFTGLSLVTGAPRPARVEHTLNLSLGFGGANTAVVVSSRRRAGGPPAERHEPVVTGVGVVLPGAVGNAAFIARGDAPAVGVPLTIPEETYAHLINARRVRRMSEYAKLTLAAAAEACSHAGIADAGAFAADACCILGTMHGATGFCEAYYEQLVREGIAGANPALFAEGVPNVAAAQLSLSLGVAGCCQTLVGSPTAGIDGVRIAAMRVRRGEWSRVFAGAAEEHSPAVDRAYAACRSGPIRSASGAVMLIIESAESARARGGAILASIDATDPAPHAEATPGAPTSPSFFSVGPLIAIARDLLEGRPATHGMAGPPAACRGFHLRR